MTLRMNKKAVVPVLINLQINAIKHAQTKDVCQPHIQS